MNLIGEQFVQNKVDKSKRLKTIILIAMIVVVVLIIAVMIMIPLFKEKKLVIKLNGEANTQIKDMLRFEEDGTIHVAIRDIAETLGYTSFSGNYINKSEDTSQCYIETNEEVVNFYNNSDKIEKIDTNTKEITYFYLDEPVQMIDGKLYTTEDGIEKGYNVNFDFDKEKNTVTINSMGYLIEQYKEAILEYGFADISTEFHDQKAILNNLVIVKDTKDQYGIFDIVNDKTILETKYSEIKYIPTTGDFLVQSNGKIGMVTNSGEEKIKMQYDSIELINQDLKLYVVKKDERYGVINQNEKIIIPINCEQIGIGNTEEFSKNNIKNKYVILDKLVPVMRNNLWGLYDIEGNGVLKYQFDEFGCKRSSVRNAENVLVIPEYNVIIGRKENKYYFINKSGEILFNGASVDEVYMTVDSDETKYYVIRNEKTLDAINLLKKLAERIKAQTNVSTEQ